MRINRFPLLLVYSKKKKLPQIHSGDIDRYQQWQRVFHMWEVKPDLVKMDWFLDPYFEGFSRYFEHFLFLDPYDTVCHLIKNCACSFLGTYLQFWKTFTGFTFPENPVNFCTLFLFLFHSSNIKLSLPLVLLLQLYFPLLFFSFQSVFFFFFSFLCVFFWVWSGWWS